MTNIKDVHNKITSIYNTQKITKVMEMVAASKMRKSQDKIKSSLPYIKAIYQLIIRLLSYNISYKHPYLRKCYDVKRVGYLVISTNRGLCGKLNISLFKKVLIEIKKWSDKNVLSDLVVIGSKGISFFKANKINIINQLPYIEESFDLVEIIDFVNPMLSAYIKGHLSKIYIASNKFINTISQIPNIIQLLPLPKLEHESLKYRSWDYLYEPDSELLLNILLNSYIQSEIYRSIIENLASEHSARMIAMKTATDNSNNIIKELKLIYNKTRQSNITQEIIEVVSGALAI